MSAMGVVPIRPSPQKLTTAACVVLTTSPVQVTATLKAPQPRRPEPPRPVTNRRRIGYSAYIPPPQPTNVLRRNARERNRVKQVNHGFAALRNHIPSAAKNKKLSKVDTLRRAVEYIQDLQAMLDENDASDGSASAQSGLPSPCQPSPCQPSPCLTSPCQPSPCQPSPCLPSPCLTSPQTLTPASGCSADSGFGEQRGYFLTSPSTGVVSGAHLSPSCSDASSPTPSFASDSTMTPTTYEAYEPYAAAGYKEEAFREAEHISMEDEELLDAIAWWQCSQ